MERDTSPMLTDSDLFRMDGWTLDHSDKCKLGALLAEVRAYRALRMFAEERFNYPMATYGESKIAELVLLVGGLPKYPWHIRETEA